MQHILLVLTQVTLHVRYIELTTKDVPCATSEEVPCYLFCCASFTIKWQQTLAITSFICLYFFGWNVKMQHWF